MGSLSPHSNTKLATAIHYKQRQCHQCRRAHATPFSSSVIFSIYYKHIACFSHDASPHRVHIFPGWVSKVWLSNRGDGVEFIDHDWSSPPFLFISFSISTLRFLIHNRLQQECTTCQGVLFHPFHARQTDTYDARTGTPDGHVCHTDRYNIITRSTLFSSRTLDIVIICLATLLSPCYLVFSCSSIPSVLT